MNFVKKVIKKFLRAFYLITLTDISGRSNKVGDVILWIPKKKLRYWFSDLAVNDYGWIHAMSKQNISFSVYRGNDIGQFFNKTIILNYHRNYLEDLGFQDYSRNMRYIVEELEKQGNKVYPTSHEVAYWENKSFMTKEFLKLNVSTPTTQLFNNLKEIEEQDLTFPFLIKEVHSASSKGVHKISNNEDLRAIVNDHYFENNDSVIVQQLLNMRKDLRVIFVGNKIVHYYWRINKGKDWKPTSTGRGSSVDFEYFPEKWRFFLISEFKKMNLVTGAFDVAWQDDDLSTKPLILEVSPNYQLNPSTKNEQDLAAYGKYKKSLYFGERGYDLQFIKQTFNIINKVVVERLKNNSDKKSINEFN